MDKTNEFVTFVNRLSVAEIQKLKAAIVAESKNEFTSLVARLNAGEIKKLIEAITEFEKIKFGKAGNDEEAEK